MLIIKLIVMKNLFKHISIVALAGLLFLSCKKDNYDAPASMLSGALLYVKDTVFVEFDRVPYQLFQYGFGKVGPIGSSFTQNGTYSSLLFDGDYKFTIPGGQGPFRWKELSAGTPDSISVAVKGNTSFNIEVTPYYMIRGAQFSASGGKAQASFSVEKIITDANAKDIERVTLYINKTQFVSGANNIGSASKNGGDITDPSSINLEVNVQMPANQATQNYVYARVGLKIAGVEDMIFSSIKRLDF